MSLLGVIGPVLRQFKTIMLQGSRDISTQGQPLLMRTTAILNAEPMKKKRKVDPAVLHAREQKRRRKLEKAIRRLEKSARKLKPVDEIVGDRKLIKEASARVRNLEPLSLEEHESRVQLDKEWSRYREQLHIAESDAIAALLHSQQRALQQLKLESTELYEQALEPDVQITPFTRRGPLHTPPIPGYNVPDGEYIDTTKTYD